jgi:protocatechuate 3,4-dioxygenase beta subunit
MPSFEDLLTRRALLRTGVGLAAAGVLAACGGDNDNGDAASAASTSSSTAATETTDATTGSTTAASSGGQTATTLAPTPSCTDDDDPTPAQTEGPYFTPNSPERIDIRAGASGTAMTLSGIVVTTDCKPVANALVDIWQADGDGEYDNSGYRLRGHQFTDAQGRYSFQTVVAGVYPGRTRHIHVKAQKPGGQILTTQLYFPGEAQNSSDNIYREECLMDVRDASGGKAATFTFVLS